MMQQHKTTSEINPTYHLLAHCARVVFETHHYETLRQIASSLEDWAAIPSSAERHGIAPLLYTHLKAAGIMPPRKVTRALKGLYLRHSMANRVKMQILDTILSTLTSAGIRVLVLKGAALANLIYPQPALRPMRDIDLLVSKFQINQAQRLLQTLGFNAPLPDEVPTNSRHLSKHAPVAVLNKAGFLISVEIHHRLLESQDSIAPTIATLTKEQPLTFCVGKEGKIAITTNYETTLWYLCRHMMSHMTVFEPHRLIWVADIISFAEHYADCIDWKKIRANYPIVLDILSILHFMTPLSEHLRGQANLSLSVAPDGIGEDFKGWPNASIAAQREKGMWGILRDTFLPSEWWMRMHYGVGSARPLHWHRWVHHPLHILGWVKHWAFDV